MTDTTPEVFEFPKKEELVHHYEMMLLISGNTTDEDAAKTFSEVKELAVAAGAEMTYEEVIGRKTLAYSVDKSRQGSYFVCEFDLISTRLPGLNEKLRIRKDVARFLIIKKHKRTAEEIATEKEWAVKREEYRAKKMIENATKSQRGERPSFKKVTAEETAPVADEKEVNDGIDKLLGDDVTV